MRSLTSCLLVLAALGSVTAMAQKPPTEVQLNEGLPPALQEVHIEQRLDEQVPLDVAFRDESGVEVRLGDYLGEKPLVLVPAYYTCPMLCSQVLHGVASSLATMGLVAGRDFEVVTFSFDDRDTPENAAAMKRSVLLRYNRPESEKGWHFLTGEQSQIQRLTEAIGFGYSWDPAISQYAHASGIMVLTPEGRLARYYYGIEFRPRDVRLGLVEAAESKIGNPVDQLLLYCYQYDPSTGKYGAVVMNILRLTSVVTIVGLLGLILILSRRYQAKTPATGRAV